MQAVASAMGNHDLLANAHRGRNRSASEAFPPTDREVENAQLPKAASYTYFPRVKDLDEPILELKGTISEDELKTGTHSGDVTPHASSGSSSPDSEDAPQMEQMPQLRPSNSRRSSRFLPFSSKSRDPSEEPKPQNSRQEARKESDSPASSSPVRSLSKLRRKSWVSQSRSSSPTKDKENQVKAEEARKNSFNLEASKRRSFTGGLSIPERARTKDSPSKDGTDSPTASKGRVLTKKPKRISGLFSSSSNQQAPPERSKAPAVPPVPKSFSTERLPSFTQTPTTPTHIPPLPRNISSEKLKGTKTEPRKKDELWTVFRTLESDLRKYVTPLSLTVVS